LLVIPKSAQTANELAVAMSNERWVRGRTGTVLMMADGGGKKMIGVAWTM
jgi:hypothetical protein